MRYFAEADRLAAALGETELREHLAAADAAVGRARWRGVTAYATMAVLAAAAVMLIGRLDSPWPLRALLGAGVFAALLTLMLLVARRPGRPGVVEPVPDATHDALVAAVDDAFGALRPRHRRLGPVLHARAFAAQVWAEARGELPDADPPHRPFDRRRARAAHWLHGLTHDLAGRESHDDRSRATLARLDRASLLVDHGPRARLPWIAFGVAAVGVGAVVTAFSPAMSGGVCGLLGSLMRPVLDGAMPACPHSFSSWPPRDREEALREIAEVFPGLRELIARDHLEVS
ncbi:hypothetical protein Afil01_18090 [Actinorhabdospora filicis]|uniref:Uncharacterized protein n=1 Tax=Actinorhabdospora filicis TaxID=1785913 RepID=A0A9W6W2G9_9ACTN|nr:hypothetical protein [Actinorhabdospora filicis]GLZ77002.1 hypothetical protein Afil01_18090 [Actinorhabdospora filicis]